MGFFRRITRLKAGPKERAVPRLPTKAKPQKMDLVNHDHIHEADPYSAEVHATRVAWYLRLSVMMNVAFGFAVISLVLLLGKMMPLQRTVPVLLTLNPALQTPEVVKALENVRAFPLEENVPSYDLIMEAFARRWAQLVLEVDNVSQGERLKRAAAVTTDDVWNRIQAEFYDDYEEAINRGLNRSVAIESSSLFSRFKNKQGETVSKYTLVMTFNDDLKGKPYKNYRRFLFLDVVSRPKAVPKDQKFENPAGLIVIDYSLKKRNS